MPAYVIVEIEVTDPGTYEEYRRQVPPSIEKYGGRFVARGGRAERLEGDWEPKRIVMLEFTDLATAKAWYASAEYAGPKKVRQQSSRARMIAVEGL
jgi:uncharacterized protein (DUF1330 family)